MLAIGFQRLGFAASILLAAGCAAIGQLRPERSVVLSVEAGAYALHQCSRRTPSKVDELWLPSADDIAKLEARLPGYLRSQWRPGNVPLLSSPLPPLRLERYYRQYVGVVAHGRRLVYISAFSPEYLDDLSPSWFGHWRTEAIVVCDGAFAFWGAEYDMETQRFRNLQFHPAI